ncbi:MAG TPA: type II CAAX endopeptidase family protein [Polyangiaceae bacterium]|nr:type II CAAX endopeptidase family protein [Polyangiaceae bacterium]
MSKEPASKPADEGPPLAPRWHTALLIALLVAVALVGTWLTAAGVPLARPARDGRVLGVYGVYLPLVAVNLGMAAYVCRVGRARSALSSLLGRGWDGAWRAGADLALAVALWSLVEAVESVAGAGSWRNAAVAALLPHTYAEKAAWVLVAATVGFCEELVYRGYLQTQLTAFTRRAGLAVALQAVLFGVAHGEQGLAVVARFTLYGVLFGALARWRRSLVPGIVAHVALDVASGLLAS